jgi:RNA polymerase sigma-70 factor (ECF subfamily)
MARGDRRLNVTIECATYVLPKLLAIHCHGTPTVERQRDKAEAQRMEQVARLTTAAAPSDQESRVRLLQIQQAFLGLPDEQRSVLHLVAIESLSY